MILGFRMLAFLAAVGALQVGSRAGVPKMQTKTATPLPATVKPGVVTGQALVDLLDHAKTNGYAIPAVNVVSSCSISGCLEAAKNNGGPMIIQFSRGGGQFYAGKAADNPDDAACIAGCVAGALHVREVAKLYGVPVILHTDHCMRSWLPWFDGLLEANEKYFEANGKPVFFVFHGGSGSSREDIRYAIEAGTIKMNIDTDTQWAFWDGMREYEAKYHDYLQGQIGNPEGATKPNKKYYDPRMPLRSGEEAMAKRLGEAMDDLNCINVI